MNMGFVRVSALSPNVTVADPAANAKSILELYRRADERGCSLGVFPELALTGCTCGDLYGQSALLKAAESALGRILAATEDVDAIAVIGLPVRHMGRVYDCAAVIQHGRLLGVVPRKTLPAKSELYESRTFAPGAGLSCSITLCGQTAPFASDMLFSCANLPAFTFGVAVGDELLSPDAQGDFLARRGASVIANPTAAAELVHREEMRQSLLSAASARLSCTYVAANPSQGESTTDMVFSGHCIIAERGRILAEKPPFEGNMCCADTDVEMLMSEPNRAAAAITELPVVEFTISPRASLKRSISRTPFIPEERSRAERILDIQARGLARRVSHVNAKTLVIGISGGLDSCLALIVAVRALDMLERPHSDVLAITMPCFGTTGRTRSNAEVLCNELGVTFREIPIGDSVKQHFLDIGHDYSDHSVTFENAQARERTQVLMDVANMQNGLVIGTGDLSELALGWATYNGDHMSMYSVNADVPKTLVRHLVRHYASNSSPALSAVLLDILDTPVSPELLPTEDDGDMTQFTEDLVGPYELHDFFLFYFLRFGFSPEKIFALACHAFKGEYTEDVIRRWLSTFLRRFFAQQFKRSCLPDGPKVGSVGISPRGDWRMPSDASRRAFEENL
ncbi:MAG: NAD(+) synthase [Clostridia bacterium]|nr:NAD(+) synthase [Clostridia bacterium]